MKNAKRRIEAARNRRERASQAVYAVEPTGNVPFSQCYAMAPQDVRDRYDTAVSELIALEQEAITAGKAWRSSIGLLTFYR